MQPGDVAILIADDVHAVQVQIAELLRNTGFKQITVTSNGEEAKVMLDVCKYHLIISDWHMGPTNGLELACYLRKHPMYKNVAFIMVTAERTKEMVFEAIKAGVDDYLVKPLTAEQIQQKVFGVLFKKKVFS